MNLGVSVTSIQGGMRIAVRPFAVELSRELDLSLASYSSYTEEAGAVNQ